MKKINIILLVMIMTMVLVGCSTGLQFTRIEQDIGTKIAARHVGAELVKEYPEVAQKISEIAQAALDENNVAAPMETISGLLLTRVEDPLLRLDIQDLLSLVDVKIDAPEERIIIIKNVLRGLVEGIDFQE